jgi:AraC family transcriptional regulator of arabinose operon
MVQDRWPMSRASILPQASSATALLERALDALYHGGGTTVVPHRCSPGWRVLPYMVCAQILDGHDTAEFDARPTLMCRAGEALCVRAGVRHRFAQLAGDGVSSISRWSHVQFTIFGSLDLLAMVEPPVVLPRPVAHQVGEVNQALAGLASDRSLLGAVKRRSLLFKLLEVIIAGCPDLQRSIEGLRQVERLAPVLTAIEERLEDPQLSVPALAGLMSLSPSRLHAVFQVVLGLPPSRHLQRRRMARAELLLIASDLRVREIARRSGYQDEFHFSRLFKRLHGVSPLTYREQTPLHP